MYLFFFRFVRFFLVLSIIFLESASAKDNLVDFKEAILENARDLLNNAEITYVYGGHKVLSEDSCQECTRCLKENESRQRNKKSQVRLSICPSCRACSLDCSHFVHFVFRQAGIDYPYLPTQTMIRLSPEKLEKNYGFIAMDSLRDFRPQPGDLLVYKGHVVLLEKLYSNLRGNIIHATSGREVRKPGQGIQRAANVSLHDFRGKLLRVLRHKHLIYN